LEGWTQVFLLMAVLLLLTLPAVRLMPNHG